MNSSLYKLVLKTPRLISRVSTKEEIGDLAQAAASGIQQQGDPHYHDDRLYASVEDIKKFLFEESHKRITEWDKENWQLAFAIFYESKPIGMVTLYSKQFLITRGFCCSYWVKLSHQGKDFGTEAVRAALSLGFDELGAREAYCGAWADNMRSLHLMEKLGFIQNGEYRMARQGKAIKSIRMKLSKESWGAPNEIVIEGLESCLKMFGI